MTKAILIITLILLSGCSSDKKPLSNEQVYLEVKWCRDHKLIPVVVRGNNFNFSITEIRCEP